MKYYTKEHQWIEMDGDVAVIGITCYAANELGDLTYVELPAVGTKVEGGKQLCVVESTKAASDVYMPVSGTIEAVNEKLDDEPELVNNAPEGDGWICRASGVDADAVAKLMDAAAYQAFLDSKK